MSEVIEAAIGLAVIAASLWGTHRAFTARTEGRPGRWRD